MLPIGLIHEHLSDICPDIHVSRLQSVIDVAAALQKSKSLTLTSIARSLSADIDIKHKVKKVDRLESNEHLYNELDSLYVGLSDYVFKYVCQSEDVPIIVDLCFMKDTHDIQMLSAELASKGRSIPLYREVFEKCQLKGRAKDFLSQLSNCIPSERQVIIIMDAGFGDEWFEAIEHQNWFWLARVRRKKYVKLRPTDDFHDVGELFSEIGPRGKNYPNAMLGKEVNRACRIITKKGSAKSQRKRPSRLPRNYNSANGSYQQRAKEPWVLATNLPEQYNTTQVLNYYKKRMQIEESFRDIKSHQYGLSGRYIRTRCIYRWGVKMMLAAIAQITLWVIGVIGHSQGFQRVFQANTVRDKKVFSYFYLGMLIIQHDKLDKLDIDRNNLMQTIQQELDM